MPSQPIRIFTWRKAAAGALALAAAVLGVGLYAAVSSQQALDHRFAAAAAAGLPNTMEQAVASTVKGSEDVLLALKDALDAFRRAEAEASPSNGDFRSRQAAVANSSPDYEAAMSRAGKCTGFRIPDRAEDVLRHGGIDHLLVVRRIRQIELARASDALRNGDGEHCVAISLRLFHVARCFAAEPTLIGYAEAVCRLQNAAMLQMNLAVRRSRLSSGALDAIEKTAAKLEDGNRSLAHLFACERAMAFANYFREMPWAAPSWMKPWTNSDRLQLFDMVQEQIDLTAASFADAEAAEARRGAQARSSAYSIRYWGAINVAPDLLQGRREAEVSRTLARCLRVVVAASRPENQSKPLSDLGLPPAAISDPFADQLLRLVRQPAGLVVYSVGPNARDDGGKLSRVSGDYLDVGLGPRSAPDGF